MIVFERFIERGRFDIEKFFEAAGIKSDEELRAYCAAQSMTMPVKEYFSAPPVPPEPEVKKEKPAPKRTRKAVTKPSAKSSAKEQVAEEPVEVPAKKPPAKTRTTRRKTAPKKTQDK